MKILGYAGIGVAILVLLVLASIYLFSDKNVGTAQSCATKNMNIVAFGDSLVAGYGATPGNDLPSLLSKTLGVSVANFGSSGDTTADALARIGDVLGAKPDIAIVLLGGNDALQRVPLATTQQNLSTIIGALQKEHIRVVLVGVMGGFGSDPYHAMFQELAKQYQVQLVPNILSGIFGNSSLMSDEVHPNDAGYAKAAAKIAPAIESACHV